MGTRSPTPNLLSSVSAREPSSSKNPPSSLPGITHSSSRHVLPADLPNAIRQLENQELDRLLAAVLAEQKRRGRKIPGSAGNSRQRQVEVPSSLPQGQLKRGSRRFQSGNHTIAHCAPVRNFPIGCTKSIGGWWMKPLKITCLERQEVHSTAGLMRCGHGK